MSGTADKVDVPSRLGLLAWLASKSPEFAKTKYAPKVTPPPEPEDSAASPAMLPPKVTDPAFWKGYATDQLEEVQAVLAAEIPKRREAEKSRDLAEVVRLLTRHGVHNPKDIAALLKTDAKPVE